MFAVCITHAQPIACGQIISPQSSNAYELTAVSEEPQSDLRLRFAWGGGAPQKWQGTISINNGSFADSRVLAITSDAPSTVIKRDDALAINHRIATSYGGVDAAINLGGDTSIQVQLESPTGEKFARTWKLAQLTEGINESIDSQQNRISISRTPGDQFRVDIERPHLVFAPGESWRFEAQLNRCEAINQEVTASLSWKKANISLPISNGTSEFTTNESGTSDSKPFEIKVPEEEGVHNLWFELSPQPKSTFGQFRRPKKITRCVQIVVVSETAQTPVANVNWIALQTLSPQQLRGSRSKWPVPRMPGTRETIRKGEFSVVSTGDSGEDAVEFSPGASLTIPVPEIKSGNDSGPIRVSLRYRRVPGTKIGINYLSSTQQVLHGMDSGISVPNESVESDPETEWLTHTFYLWPEPNPGHLFLSCDDPQIRAQIGELKFESGPARLQSRVQRSDNFDPAIERRERMAFLESPDFGGLFQSQRTVDPQSGQSLDDWNTFYQSIDRLTQHLKAHAYDGAFVTVSADGSAIFPSAGLAPGPRFDSGIFSSLGCDPVQKDVVELMLRMFDRDGLKLVPVLTLNSSLPALESAREAGRMSFDLLDFEGQSVDFDRSQLPIYNPLDRSLQDVCSQGIQQFVYRYQNRSSFGGLALTCRPDCCTMLPGSRHGFDNTTLQRFVQAENINTAEFDINALVVEGPTNVIRETWLAWRSGQMARWYSDLAAIVRSRPEHRLYLLPIDIDRKRDVVTAMSPSLHRSGDFGRIMFELGLSLDTETMQSGVAVLAARQVAPGYSLAQRRVDLSIAQSRTAEQFLANQTDGSLFTHRGNWRRIESGIESPVAGLTTRKQLFTIAGDSNRRRYIEAIRKFDSRLIVDGGDSLPFGGDEEVERIARILQELPAERFTDVGDSATGPICIRQLSVDGQHFFYAINDSPWPMEVTAWLGQKRIPQVLQASANSNGKAAPLMTFDGKEVQLEQREGRTAMRIFLDPWTMYAAASQTNSAFNPYAIESFDVALPEQVDSRLRKQLYQVKSKLAKAKTAQPMSQLLNGSFESFADPDRSGWEFGNHDGATFELDSSKYRDGRTSLTMGTKGNPVWIRSNTLQMPTTGRLSVSAWLRTDNAAENPRPRISIECVSDGESIYRFGTIGAIPSEGETSSLDATWRRFVVHFDDLPPDALNLRVGFDLMSKGEVSIDQVEVYDRWFDESDSVALTQLLASAGSQLQNDGSMDEGRRVLESYWVQFLDQYIGKEEPVAADTEKTRPFDIPLPQFEMPSFELPDLAPKKSNRVPLFQRFQRRE
ncbi:hypothetical protein [Mariniblastus fucicola]|uniref:hypothetical protein n=1 Tax=Mariniblastus fucicola TaxID=980251 RepID=UPI0012FBEFB3|nr:hypothetical protein [Mariniblastus fucicola]